MSAIAVIFDGGIATPCSRSSTTTPTWSSTGATNRQIAADLFISEKTASLHVSNIMRKLGVSNRGQAAAVAHREGLLV